MSILISDWGDLDRALPLAQHYHVGIELASFTITENLDNALGVVPDLLMKISTIPMITMHAPYSDLIPASRDPLVREVARTRLQQGYALAQKIGASHMVVHSGFIPKTYPAPAWIQYSYQFWVDFLADKPANNFIHMENVYENDFESLIALVDQVNAAYQDDRLTLCLDIGHVSANSNRTMAEWIRGLGDRIRYVHLHNNAGILDDHWRLDQGEIDINNVLDLLQVHAAQAVWSVETESDDTEPSLHWLQDNGYL